MVEFTLLTGDELSGLATERECLEAVRDAYRQRGNGAPAKPRTKLTDAAETGMLTSYLAMLPESGIMGGYMYAAGFAHGDAWLVAPLFDADAGDLVAILDGAIINPLKTGAVGALGIDVLARDDASTLAIIGSGVQARGQMRAATHVRDLECVRVYSPTKAHRRKFAAEFDESLNADVTDVDNSAEAVRDADIIVTATRATDPVFDGDLLQPGAHVSAIGQYDPGKRELDMTTIERANYVPDLRERAFKDAGSFLHALECGAVDKFHVHAELGEVVAGKKSGRESASDITLFDSGGTAIETVGVANFHYRRALEAGLGSTVRFWSMSENDEMLY